MLLPLLAGRQLGLRLLLPHSSVYTLRSVAANAAAAAAAAARLQSRHSSSSSNSSSSNSSSSRAALRGVEEELLQQLQLPRRLTVDEVLQSIQRLLQRQYTSFAHPSCSSSSNSSSSSSSSSNINTSILPDEFVAFISSAAAAAAQQQQQHHVLLNDSRFKQLLQQLRSRLLGFSVPQLYRLLLALARLQHCPGDVVSRVLSILSKTDESAAAGPLQQLTPKQLAQLPLLLAAATGCCSPTLSSCSYQQQQQQQQQQHIPKADLAAFLQIYSQYVCRLLQQQQHFLGGEGEAFTATDTAAAAAGAAAAGDTAAAAAAAATFTAEDLSFLLVGFSSLRVRHLLLINLAADALRLQLALQFGGPTAPQQQQQQQQQQGEEMQQQQLMLLPLSSVLLALATLGATNGPALQEVSYQLARVTPLLSVSRLSDCLVAVAALQNNPSTGLSLNLLSEVERQLAERAWSCSFSDAVTAAWAAVALQLHRGSHRLLLPLLQQLQLLQQQGAIDTEDMWGELPLRLQQLSLELCLDPQAKPLLQQQQQQQWLQQQQQQLLQQEQQQEGALQGPPSIGTYPTSTLQRGSSRAAAAAAATAAAAACLCVWGEAAETQRDEKEMLLEQEIQDFIEQESVRQRLLLTVDARLQQQQQQQQQQEGEEEQQQQQQQEEEEEEQQQQQQLADEATFQRVEVSVHFKGFPCLRTYRVGSLFVWPSTKAADTAAAGAAGAAAGAAGAAAGATVTAADVLQAEQQRGSSNASTLADMH
ncbi:hypothetical protein, conserved [Eimeria praecox]|uniref:Uncharacterized protein n=1 Tax=Eimeria praecox TaxID=51316 RepID=U6G3F4_9EIME|nr:hypothetical protein, conserved [Eimeria praecox]